MTYRPEIDGLRSIAVLSVLLFHLGVPVITGGFTGVDVFFVISGYLITGILMRDLSEGRFSLAEFYRRRALRILPALAVVLIATVILSRWALLPSEIATLGRSVVAALLFVSNIFFWSELDYFNPDAKENPLLHTWSLGVEEQFYIFVPIGMWLIYRYARRALIWIFAASVLGSFVLSAWAVEPMPRASFYLLPTRYWELGAGALLALADFRAGGRMRIAPTLAQGLAGLGLILIAVGLFGLSADSVFPGPAALWPVLGAVALIAAGGESFAGRILSMRGPVWMGKISYSLYLWHWPLIVLWKLRTDPYFSALEIVVIGALSIVMAALSTRFVEQPFRHIPKTRPTGRILVMAALVLAVGSALGWGLSQRPGLLRQHDPEVIALDGYADYFDQPEFRALWQYHKCHLDPRSGGFKRYDAAACLAQDDRPTVLVFGDSHAAHIWEGLARARPDLNVVQASSTNCRPLPVHPATTFCGKLSRFIYDDWVAQAKPDVVVLSGVWRDAELPALAQGIALLQAQGAGRVVVLGDTVNYAAKLPKILARLVAFGGEEATRLRDHLIPGQWERDAELRAVVEGAGGDFVDLFALICPGGPEGCRARIDGVPFLFDSNHYTTPAARDLGRALAGAIGPEE